MTPSEIITEALYNIYGSSTPDASVMERAKLLFQRAHGDVQKKVPWWFLEDEVEADVDSEFEVVSTSSTIWIGSTSFGGYKKYDSSAKINQSSAQIITTKKHVFVFRNIESPYIDVFLRKDMTNITTIPAGRYTFMEKIGTFIWVFSTVSCKVINTDTLEVISLPYYFGSVPVSGWHAQLYKGNVYVQLAQSINIYNATTIGLVATIPKTLQLSKGYVEAGYWILWGETGTITVNLDNMTLSETYGSSSEIHDKACDGSASYRVTKVGNIFQISDSLRYTVIHECPDYWTEQSVWMGTFGSITLTDCVVFNCLSEVLVAATGKKVCSFSLPSGTYCTSCCRYGAKIYISYGDTYYGGTGGYAEVDVESGTVTFTDMGRSITSIYVDIESKYDMDIEGLFLKAENGSYIRLIRKNHVSEPFISMPGQQGAPTSWKEKINAGSHMVYMHPQQVKKTRIKMIGRKRVEIDFGIEDEVCTNLEEYLIKKLTADISIMTEYQDRYVAYTAESERALAAKIAENCDFTAQEFTPGYCGC